MSDNGTQEQVAGRQGMRYIAARGRLNLYFFHDRSLWFYAK